MTDRITIIEVASLYDKSYSCVLPKDVRIELGIEKEITNNTLSFAKEDDGELTIGFGGRTVIGAAKISRNYQITIPENARNELELEKGSKISFWKNHTTGKIFIRNADK